MNVSSPREPSSGPLPIPLVLPSSSLPFVFILSSCRPRLGSSQKELASCSLLYPLLNLSNTDYGAKCYTRAECNTILSLSLHYIYIRVCVLYVRVRVCVCDPDMALLAPFLNTPLLLYPSPDGSTHCVFFVFVLAMWLPWIHHIIINTPRPQVCVFTCNHCGVACGKCILFLVPEGRPVFLRYSNFGAVISIH
jgi:hypothetical protein